MKLEKIEDVYDGVPDVSSKKSQNLGEKKDLMEELILITSIDIVKKVIDYSDNTQVHGLININKHYQTIMLGSSEAKRWLQLRYYQENDEICSQELCKEVLQIISSQTSFDSKSKKENIYNRIAMTNDAIYYDMATPDWKIVKITKDGWEILDMDEDMPMFERKQQQLPQVFPKKSNSRNALDEYCKLLRISDKDKMIFKIHLVSFFIEKYPIPIMILTGDQGSNKTTLMQSVKFTVDPSAQLSAGLPNNKDNFSLHLYNRYMAAFDNVSSLNQEMSDLLCRVITGEGDSKRQHYENLLEVIMTYRRKIIMNGIAPILEFPDLIDRSIFYEVTPITGKTRLTLEEFYDARDELMPYLIHQIFDILCKAMSHYDQVKIDLKGKMQRMSDFSIWGESIARAMGIDNMVFIEFYSKRISMDALDIVNSYPIFSIIQKIMSNCDKYEESITKFYNTMKDYADEMNIDKKSKEGNFPKGANKLRQQIKVLRPTFKELGFEVTLEKNYTVDKVKGWTRGAMILRIFKDNTNPLFH